MAVNRIYCATGLTGGGTGALDTIDGADLADKDMAIVIDQTTVYFFALDADSAAAESSPNTIKPDNNAGDKRWILQSLRINDLTVSDDVILVTDDITVGGTLEVQEILQVGDADGTGATLNMYSNTAGDTVVFDPTNKVVTLTDINLTMAGTGTINAGDNNISNVATISVDAIASDGASFTILNNWTNAGNTVTNLGTVSTVDINGGTIDGVTIFGVATDTTGSDASIVTGTSGTSGGLSVWNADGDLVAGPEATAASDMIVATGSGAWAKKTIAEVGAILETDLDHGNLNGLSDDDHTQYLLASGARALAGAWDMGDYALTNVNIDSGSISGATINTVVWNAAQDFADQNLTNVNIDSGSISGATINTVVWNAAQDFADQNLTNVNIDSGSITSATIATSCTQTEWDAAYTHVSSDGSDHSFIDQDVTSGATPTFGANNFSDGGGNAIVTTTQETNWDTHLTSTGADHTYIDQSVVSGASPTFTAANLSDGGGNAIVTTTQETNWDNHLVDNGADHSFIDQSVVSGASPTFDGANFTGVDADDVDIADAGGIITATDVEGALQENRTAINLNTTHRSSDGSDHTFIDQDVTSGASPTFSGANISGVSGATATMITAANEATDTTCFPLFVTAATGDLAPKTNANLAFDSNKGQLTVATITATTNFNVGNTVITDGAITDNGTIIITSGGTTAIRSSGGTDYLTVGQDDTKPGWVKVYGTNGTQGGILELYNASNTDTTDEYFRFYASTSGDLTIGRENDPDMIKVLTAGTVAFTVDVDVDAALTATTVDADTDFTVGGTVITDNTITDDGEFLITSPSGVRITDTVAADDAELHIGTADTQRGVIFVHGDATGDASGGGIFLYTAFDHDDTYNYFSIRANSAVLELGDDTNPNSLNYTGTQWNFEDTVDVDAALTATTVDADTDFTVGGTVITDNTITDDGTLVLDVATSVNVQSTATVGSTVYFDVGESDSIRGAVRLRADDNTAGPGIDYQVPPDNDGDGSVTFTTQIEDNTDDFYMGFDNDPDMLTFLGGATPSITANCAVDVDAALTATTVDADTDFTVGGTVITDGNITDDGTLHIKHASRVEIEHTGAAGSASQVYIGSEHAQEGILYLYGDNATGNPRLRFYLAANEDGNGVDYFDITVSGDDLIIGSDQDATALKLASDGDNTLTFAIQTEWTATGETCADLGTVTTADINGGTLAGVTVDGSLTWSAAQDLGDQNLTNVNIDSGSITNATINTVVWNAAQDFADQNLTNVNIDSGSITGATINACTWNAAQDLADQNLTNVNIDSGSITGATINACTWSAAQDLNDQALTNVNIDSGDINGATITSVTLADNGTIVMAEEPGTDHVAQGLVTAATVDTNAYSTMGLVYLNSADGHWDTADKDAESTAGVMLGMALGTIGNGVNVLLQGMARDDSWNWTVGEPVYVGDAGAATDGTGVAAFGTNDVVRCIGYAMTDDSIWFNPSNDWIEVA